MDIVAVLTKVVHEQQRDLAEKSLVIARQQQTLERFQAETRQQLDQLAVQMQQMRMGAAKTGE